MWLPLKKIANYCNDNVAKIDILSQKCPHKNMTMSSKFWFMNSEKFFLADINLLIENQFIKRNTDKVIQISFLIILLVKHYT